MDKLHVLILEDDPADADLAIDYIRPLGWTCEHASTVERGRELVSDGDMRFGLMLVDFQIGGDDEAGLGFIREVRAMAEIDQPAIVAMSHLPVGQGGVGEFEQRSHDAGADAFVEKWPRSRGFQQLLNAHVAKRRSDRPNAVASSPSLCVRWGLKLPLRARPARDGVW